MKRKLDSDLMRRRQRQWGDTLNAYLVESSRDGAKVRQRVIGYIGTVSEGLIGRQHISDLFWREAMPRIDGLKLPRQQRAAVIEKVSAVVPKNVDNGRQS